jgi:phospholipid transport system substrate-binding protein
MLVAHAQIGLVGKRFISKVLILAVCLCLWGSQALAARTPETVIQNGTDQIRKILDESSQDTRARREQIRAIIDTYFDFDALARLSLGPQWRNLSPEQQQEFTREFSRLLFNTYVGNIEKVAALNISYHLRSITPGYVVVTALVADQGGGLSLDYYLHLRNGEWKVYDVAAQGMSLAANYRNQFDSILANSSFDHLSTVLRERIAQTCRSGRC